MLLNVKSEVGRKWSSLPEGACMRTPRGVNHASHKRLQPALFPSSAIVPSAAVACIKFASLPQVLPCAGAQAYLELHVGPVHVIVVGVLEALHGAAEVLRAVLQLVRLEPVGAEPGDVALAQRHLLYRLPPGVVIPQVLVVDPGCRHTIYHEGLGLALSPLRELTARSRCCVLTGHNAMSALQNVNGQPYYNAKSHL